ncbi:hypothetical protein A2110_00705 [Candidatus Jorgensenbacteria bacterium GWA1_54_12]|uniref:PD-(D/E)XK endonuclease-like domain-containing protein n=1 Tax=Candidatus Jorgensenbacteria bacterium GWA1_54_12 TaxID=1798468 RepID=A0A1F6BLB3_9BACT|nr:MAG: hypothetical protein A2110_00705 [Candidatus Jorgensenbacteria bacterium GWA1_54_12]
MRDEYKNLDDFKEKSGYDIDGVWFPRVTKIVSIKAKPALNFFYASLKNYAEGERIKKISAEEGTHIHETVQSILTGGSPAVDENMAPSIKAFMEFAERTPIEVDPDYIERRIANLDERFAGTIDALALIDGKLGILDIKTSQAIYRDYNLQTSAYLATLKKDVKELQTRWILRIDQAQVCTTCGALLRNKGGRTKVKIDWANAFMRTCMHSWSPLPIGEVELKEFPLWEDDFRAFLGAKTLWEWENETWLKAAGYLQ